jgi:hypothetical protein
MPGKITYCIQATLGGCTFCDFSRMPVANTICFVEKLVKYILKIEAACELLRDS